jgi:hypothetical protein
LQYINDRSNVWNDPEKRKDMMAAANSLALKGYDRNSPEYFAAIDLAVGLTDASGLGDGPQIISDSEVARISKSKYGETSPQEIQQGKERLALLKQYKLYPMDQTS